MQIKVTFTQMNVTTPRQVVSVYRVAPFGIPSGITNDEFTAKGDLLVGSSSGNFLPLPVGSNGSILIANSAEPTGLKWSAAGETLPRGYLNGYTLTNNVTDANNDIDIAIGSAKDSTNTSNISRTSSITKRLDASWTVGTNAGGLDTGSKANSTWYHVFVILKNSDNSVDVLFSTSVSSPTMPSGYTYFRRVGSVRTDSSGNIIPFLQYGNEFMWKSPILNFDSTSSSTRGNLVLSVPLGVAVKARVNVVISGASVPVFYFSNPNLTDMTPSYSAAPLLQMGNTAGSYGFGAQLDLWTDTSSQISHRVIPTGMSLKVATTGWYDLLA